MLGDDFGVIEGRDAGFGLAEASDLPRLLDAIQRELHPTVTEEADMSIAA